MIVTKTVLYTVAISLSTRDRDGQYVRPRLTPAITLNDPEIRASTASMHSEVAGKWGPFDEMLDRCEKLQRGAAHRPPHAWARPADSSAASSHSRRLRLHRPNG